MASTLEPVIQTLLADAAISKGMAVKFGTDFKHVAKGAANTDRCIGIAQSAPTAAEDAVEVAFPGGGAKGLLGESVSAGNDLCAHTDGTLVKVNASGDAIIARAMQGGSSGDLIDVLVYYAPALAAQ
jgi:hypothetical protein